MNSKNICGLIFLFYFLSFNSRSQDRRKIDSLFKLSYNTLPDSTRSDLFQAICFHFQQIDLDSAIKHGKTSLAIAEKIKDRKRIAIACMSIGSSHMGVGEFDQAFGYYKRAMHLYFEMGNPIEASGALNNIGLVFWNKSDYPRALNCFFNVYKLAKPTNKKRYMANALGNIGLIYWSMSDFKNALEYQLKCLSIREEMKDKYQIAVCLSNVGIDYESLHDYKRALNYHLRSLKISEELGSTDLMATTYGNIGVVYSDLGKEDEALEFQQKSLKLHEQLGDKNGIALAYSNIGNNYNKRKDFKKALEYYQKSRALNEEIGEKQNVCNVYINICNNLTLTKQFKDAEAIAGKALVIAKEIQDIGCESEVESGFHFLYKEMGRPEKALEHYERHIKLRDSIYKKDNEKEIARKEFQYLLDKNEAAQKLEQQKVELSHQNESLVQRIVIGCAVLVLLVLIVFSVSLFKRFTITRKQNEIIEEKQREIIDSINYAKRIQTALMAHAHFMEKNIPDHFTLFKPKAIVSGDFYWVNKKEDRFYLGVCDSTGHGVPGAFMSLLNISFLNEAINEKNILDPDKILNYVRERLVESISKDEHQDGFDGIILCFDQKNSRITYSAANNKPLLIQNNAFKELPTDKMPVGKGEKNEPFTLHAINANKGDTLYLYSDGYADQFGGPQGKKFKYKALNQMLLEISDLPLKEQLHKLEQAFETWKGPLEQVDDVCVIGLRL